MIPSGLFTQIATIGLSIGIFFTYIQPSFNEVKADQDTILRYQTERSKVNAVNIKLNELVLKSEEITREERKALETYIPSEVDAVAVQRDLLTIAERAGVKLSTLQAETPTESVTGSEEGAMPARSRLLPYEFQLAFNAPYETIKEFLELVEVNNYPLILTSLAITAAPQDGATGAPAANDLTVLITLTTYALEYLEQPVSEPVF